MTNCITYDREVRLYPQRNFKTDRGWVPKRLHRVIWEERFGPIPQGLQIHHLCENKRCLNIEHYALIANGEHMRRFHRQSHCKRGHALIPANVYVRPDNGKRMCRVCIQLRNRGES